LLAILFFNRGRSNNGRSNDGQATIEDAGDLTNAELPDATTFTLYIPNFVQQYSLSGKTLAQQNTELLQKDWLTPGLTHEIESLFPIASEINRHDDNKCD
jgi:hypothetical protein